MTRFYVTFSSFLVDFENSYKKKKKNYSNAKFLETMQTLCQFLMIDVVLDFKRKISQLAEQAVIFFCFNIAVYLFTKPTQYPSITC